MPELGEIRRGSEIGQGQRYNHFIWQACEKCGKERWVKIIRNQPDHVFCKSCQLKKIQIANRGSGNNSWKGGMRQLIRGYVGIWVSLEDFFAPMRGHRGYVLEHRLVMAKHLGRCLHSWEIVHHKNGIKDDNRIENLQLVTDDRHKQITILENRINYLEKRVSLLEAENVLLRNERDVPTL